MLKEIYAYIFKKSTLLLTREQLGSIEPYREWSEEDRQEINNKITGAYDGLSKIISKLVQEQMEFQTHNCNNDFDTTFSRGTINGMELIQDYIDANRILPEDK